MRTIFLLGLGFLIKPPVVAEGVETADQLDFLRHRNCDQVQGFYYSQPIPGKQFSEWLMAK